MKRLSSFRFLLIKVFGMAICLAAIPMCSNTTIDKEIREMRELVPDEIHGWRAQTEFEVYDRETIFDYIDGAGEIYLLYDFRKVVVLRLIKEACPPILVELFDMSSSEEAYGIFSHAREGEEQGFGQGSEYRGGLLCFWKANYFVCISSEQETPETEKAVTDLARTITANIKVAGTKPELLDYLPEEGLIDQSVRYFHKHTSLNYHYYVASQNLLNLSPQTDAVLAEYQPGQSYLLYIRYQGSEEAEAALDSFLSTYMPEGKESGMAQIHEEKWVSAKSTGQFLVVIFDAPTKAYALKLMKATENRLPEAISGGGRDS
jgi:hypothetical protein